MMGLQIWIALTKHLRTTPQLDFTWSKPRITREMTTAEGLNYKFYSAIDRLTAEGVKF